jgi:hypothetical protein
MSARITLALMAINYRFHFHGGASYYYVVVPVNNFLRFIFTRAHHPPPELRGDDGRNVVYNLRK